MTLSFLNRSFSFLWQTHTDTEILVITAFNRNTGCPLSVQEVQQRRGGESCHSTLWWSRINLTTETKTWRAVKHSAVWAELKLPELNDVSHILNLHADAEGQKNTFTVYFSAFSVFSIFTFHLFHTSTSCRSQQKVWSLTGFPLWHPANRKCVRLILLKCVCDAFMSRHVQHCH